MEDNYFENKKEQFCKIGYSICELPFQLATSRSYNISSIRQLHSSLHDFTSRGTQLLDLSLDPIFRKKLRILLMHLNEQFFQTQLSELESKTSFSFLRNAFLKRIFDICTFVKEFKPAEIMIDAPIMLSKINSKLDKVCDSRNDGVPARAKSQSESCERLLNQITSHQINKLTLKDLDSFLYRKAEEPISHIKSEAYGGRKDVVGWSLFMQKVHNVFDVGSHLLQNQPTSLTLSTSELKDMKENLKNLSELLALFHGLIFDVIHLIVHPSNSLERSAVLLTNTIYMLRNTIDTELNVWNPVVKDVFMHMTWRNSTQLETETTELKIQLDKLFHIFTLCSPSTDEWMSSFQKINQLYLKLVSRGKNAKNKMQKDLFLNKGNFNNLEDDEDEDREEIHRSLLYKMYLLIYNTIQTLVLLLGFESVDEVFCAYDWSNIEGVAGELSEKIKEVMIKLETKKSNEVVQDTSLNLKTKDDIFIVSSYSAERIQRFNLMQELLDILVSSTSNNSLNVPITSLLIKPSHLKSAHSLSSLHSIHHHSIEKTLLNSNFKNLPFDSDCLKLFIILCQVQILKTKVFLEKNFLDLLKDELKYMPLTQNNSTKDNENINNNIENTSNLPSSSSLHPAIQESPFEHTLNSSDMWSSTVVVYEESADEMLLNNIDELLKNSRHLYDKLKTK